MNTTRLQIEPIPGFTRRVGQFLAMMEDVRMRTLRYVADLTADQLAWHPNPKVESIGTLLLHIAAAEHSYIQEDIMRRPMGEEWKIAFPIRFGLPQLTGKPLEYYTEKLDGVRQQTRDVLKTLSDGDLTRVISPLDPGEPENRQIEFSIEWLLYHLIEHEAHHKGQIAVTRRLLPV